MGSQDNFPEAQDFLSDTGIGGADSELTILWEGSGNIWGLNQVRTNSAMQLLSHDLSVKSGVIFFNDQGKDLVLSESGNAPWSP